MEQQEQPRTLIDIGWLCHCFDNAVMWFGHWVENQLQELDKVSHQPLHTLEELLGTKPQSEMDDVRGLIAAFGVLDLR